MSDGDPLARVRIAARDPSGMLDDVLDQHAQLTDALLRFDSAGIAQRERPGGLAICGMGGSAIGADLARAAIGRRARAPIGTVRDYELPPWTAADALVACASYSGGTEETLACFEAAGAAGLERVAVTTGGELAAAARAAGVPVVGVPSGMQPRAAVAYMTVAALECAAACEAAPSLRDEVAAASALLAELAQEWGPDAADGSTAKALARRLAGTLPVVFGAGPTAPVAYRWKTQLNENPGIAAFAAELPEADHNEICAWSPEATAPLFGLFLEDPALRPSVRRRVELTAALCGEQGAGAERVAALGDAAVARLFSLVFLGDLVSVYLAVLLGRDPTPVEPIERFKAALGDGIASP